MTAKRSRGRPSFTGNPGIRYQVTIPPDVADKYRKVGKGSLTLGMIRVADKIKP